MKNNVVKVKKVISNELTLRKLVYHVGPHSQRYDTFLLREKFILDFLIESGLSIYIYIYPIKSEVKMYNHPRFF